MMSYLLAFLFLILPAEASWAGVDSSGGGDNSVAYFVASAEALLGKIEFRPEHRRLLKKTLRSSRIVSTPTLRNPETGRPVENQGQMIAYSSLGLIQLKDASASGESWGAAVREKRPLAHIVIHELFRASGLVGKAKRSVDDTFQLSIGLYKLNKFDSFGEKLGEPVELHYWKCQCFESDRAGSPDGGMNLVDVESLRDAETRALRSCREDLGAKRATLARCHKFVGDPSQD